MGPDDLDGFVRAGRRRLLFQPTTSQAVSLDRAAIEELIPHRDPFLLLDRITAVDREGASIAGARCIDPSDPLFEGHFPGAPIYPGVLLLEMMGQLGLCLLGLDEPRTGSRGARALKVHHAIFLAPVLPGDEVSILAKVVEADEYTAICAGQVVKDEALICAFAVMEVFFVES